MVYDMFTPPYDVPFYTATETPSPTSGYFPPASVWGAQRSNVDLKQPLDGETLSSSKSSPTPTVGPFRMVHGNDHDDEGEDSDCDDFWPKGSTQPLRLSTHRLTRKLPPRMTESLEQLALAHVETHDYSLGSVPEDAPARPLRKSFAMPPVTTQRPSMHVRAETLAKLQQLQVQPRHPPQQLPQHKSQYQYQHRRTASVSQDTVSRPAVPRSPSLPHVQSTFHVAVTTGSRQATLKRIATAPRPRLVTNISAPVHMPSRNSFSSGSSASDHTNEWIRTPVSSDGTLPNAALDPASPSPSPTKAKPQAQPAPEHRPASVAAFDALAKPDGGALLAASDLEVLDEAGHRVRFGDLVGGPRRTVVIFVRHWLSSYCAQYIRALMNELPAPVLAGARARLIIIGHGSHDMIPGFRQHFTCPFPVYTDPSRRLHATLGMLARPLACVPRADYVVHNAVVRAVEMLALAGRIHGFRSGDRDQLGAEYVFDGSLHLLFAHRMAGVADHAVVSDIRAAMATADYRSPAPLPRAPVSTPVPRPAPMIARKSSVTSRSNSDFPFPLPPIRVSEEDAEHWNAQRASLMARRQSKPRTTFNESRVSIVHADDIDALTGEHIHTPVAYAY
jgi:hypothetical protein